MCNNPKNGETNKDMSKKPRASQRNHLGRPVPIPNLLAISFLPCLKLHNITEIRQLPKLGGGSKDAVKPEPMIFCETEV
jgi:hypothetical protein